MNRHSWYNPNKQTLFKRLALSPRIPNQASCFNFSVLTCDDRFQFTLSLSSAVRLIGLMGLISTNKSLLVMELSTNPLPEIFKFTILIHYREASIKRQSTHSIL